MVSMAGRTRVLGAALALIFAGCTREAAPPGGPARPTTVLLQTNWFAEAEFGGYYQALAKGFFRDENLDVRIIQGGPGALPVQKIATGQVQFALARSDDLMLAAQQKIPVLIVAAQLEHDPQVIIVHADSPVRSFRDLDGKSIMVEPGSAWISHLERKFSIHINTIPENYGIAQFVADKNFIQQGFLTWEPYVFDQLKVSTRSMLIADSGYDPYRALFCNRDYAMSHPDVVRAFIRASLRGWKDYLGPDPSPANALITGDHAETTPAVLAYSLSELKRAHIVDGDAAKGERIGLIRRKRLEEQIGVLRELGLLTGDMKVGQVASFEFLPQDLREAAER